MRKAIVNITAFMVVAGTLGSVNVTVDTFQFWICMIGLTIVQINSSID